MTSDEGILTLTTKRVPYDAVEFGFSKFVSITLDAVASCSLITRSYPILFLLAAVVVVIGLSQNGDAAAGFMILGLILFVAYFVTRVGVIAIASKGGEKIQVPTKGMSRNAFLEFLEALEQEKLS